MLPNRLLSAALSLAAVAALAGPGGCVTESQATFTVGTDDDPTGADEVGEPCLGQGDCAEGLYCVATPCTSRDGGAGEPVVPEAGCGEFSCQLLCASEGHLLCADAFGCCSGDLECNSRSQCVEPN